MNGRDRMMVGLGAGLAGAAVVAGVSFAVVASAQPSTSTPAVPSPREAPQTLAPSAPASSSLEELQAKANMITDPGQETALQRAAVDPGMQPVSGEGPQPTIYDPATVAAGDPGTMRFEVTRVEQEGKILWALGNGYYGDTNAGEGKLPFVQDDGEWRIDRSWVCALTQRPEGGYAPQPGCEAF